MTRVEPVKLGVGDLAPDLTLSDDRGQPLALSSLWSERPRVLLFVRHFGCPLCREQVADVRDDYAQFQAAGGDVAVITMGSPEQTAEFRQRNELPFVCLADSEQRAYAAFGVPRASVLQVAGPAVWWGGLKAVLRAGWGKPTGDLLQLHGAFVIDTQGRVRYLHLPRHSADRPSNQQLIEQLRKLS